MQRILSVFEHAYHWARQKFVSTIEPDFDPEQHIAREWSHHRPVDIPCIRRR